jgi:DNA polymerase-1
VYGFTSSIFALLRAERPDHLAVCFDPPGPTFRHERYAEYKATRERMPEELIEQMPRVREVVRALGYPVLEIPGFEADDVLATVARRASREGARVYLVTGDKDLFQLVDDRVSIYNVITRGAGEAEVLDAKGVEEKFGVPPGQVADVLALMGDSSDNVPGVRGIGPKTAVELVRRFGSLEQVLARSAEVEKPRVREALERDAANARLSYELVKIPADAPVEFSFEDAAVGPPDPDAAGPVFEALGFRRFLQDLPGPPPAKEEGRRYRTVRTAADLGELVAALRAAPIFTFDTETTGTDPLAADPVGLSFSTGPMSAWYVPLNADPPILAGRDGGDREGVLEALRPVLEDPARPKAGQNAKYDLLVYRAAGVRVEGLVHDTMILSFALDPRERTHNLDDLAHRHLGLRKIPTSDLLGKGKDQVTMAAVPIERVAEYACEDADATLRVLRALEPRLPGSGAERLYREVEMPLVPVLADMEARGIRVDAEALERMGADLKAREERLSREIQELAGEEFNVNSTQQLGAILYEKLKVQGSRKAKRTKTGYRTDVETLEEFASHAIVGRVLEYRGCTKLRSTYLEPLPRLVNPRTGRLHTSFSQIGAVTGRLSSSNPNLQNIPVRTAEGRAIRRCFVPGERGWKLLSADYSQIELRVLAHLAEDPGLIEAFEAGEDIHRATAARIFGLLPGAVTAELRGRAKAINFGVVYGMGEQRLARETGIPVAEARRFIEAYFRTYPRVRAFHEAQLARAMEEGFVETLFGRRRWIRDELTSGDGGIAANARNNAINTPIQGTAAEIVKLAMIRLQGRLAEGGLDAHLLLQVHDELVLECPAASVPAATALVKETLETVLDLRVPLVVEVGSGDSWLEAH